MKDRTNPGIGPGGWRSGALAEQQERAADDARKLGASNHVAHVPAIPAPAVTVYRIYTERYVNLSYLVTVWFGAGAIIDTIGVWTDGQNGPSVEHGSLIEIIGRPSDYARVISLARVIRRTNEQVSVLVTWHGPAGLQSLDVRD